MPHTGWVTRGNSGLRILICKWGLMVPTFQVGGRIPWVKRESYFCLNLKSHHTVLFSAFAPELLPLGSLP